jgi:hypothetical protein
MDFHVEPFETCRPNTSFVVKMHSDYEKNYYACENFELLCDLNLILDLPCVMPILEEVHSFIKYVQCRYVFIMDFLDAINIDEAELFYLYIDGYFLVLMIYCLMISLNYLTI